VSLWLFVLVSFLAVLTANTWLGALLTVIHRRQHPLRAEAASPNKGMDQS
jgi:hypothetical protein